MWWELSSLLLLLSVVPVSLPTAFDDAAKPTNGIYHEISKKTKKLKLSPISEMLVGDKKNSLRGRNNVYIYIYVKKASVKLH